MDVKASRGAITIGGELEGGDYFVRRGDGSPVKVRVDASGTRIVDGDLPDGDYVIGGHYSDVNDPNLAFDVPAVEAEPFDPSGHNMADVNEYLDTADDEERARVLEAERAGKKRVGILDGPYGDAG